MQESLGTLYVRGASIDWEGVDRDYARRRVALPTYPWTRQRYTSAASPPVAASTSTVPVAETFEAATAAASRQAEQAPLDLNVGSYADKFASLNRLAGAYTTRALLDLDVFSRPGERHSVADLVEQHGVGAGYRKLIERWLHGLAEDGLLEATSDAAFVSPAGLAEPPLDALERAAAATLGDVPPLLDYVKRAGRKLAAIVRGTESALDTLFPGGDYATVDYLYHTWPVTRYMNQILAASVEAAVRGRRDVRVLEVGAGTGGTTRTLLPLLRDQSVHYTFTDVSDFFLSRAEERLAEYPFVEYRRLDLETDPLAQGFSAHEFDVALAANAVHATRDLDASLDHLRRLLAPGGMLVLYEATTHPRWFDVTTALIEGWQRFADTWRTDQPLLDVERWQAALGTHGFDAVSAYPATGSPAEVVGQHIILARADQTTAEPRATDISMPSTSEASSGGGSHGKVTEAAALLADLAAALPGERHDLWIDYVRGHVARVLRYRQGDGLAPDARLLDLGLDSLMAVELRGRLAEGLPLERGLPATLVFDYPSIDAIAEYLDTRLAPTAPEPTATHDDLTPEDITSLGDDEVMRLLLDKLEDVSTAL
jgi:SAM-dependent methyltransferase